MVVFMTKSCKRLIRQNLELKKYLKQKETNYLSNGKDITILFMAGLIKWILQYGSTLNTILKFWNKC